MQQHLTTWSRWVILLVLWSAALPIVAQTTNTITGVVYEDFNANGVLDTAEPNDAEGAGTYVPGVDAGVGGVTITAYALDAPDENPVGSTLSNPNGTYTLSLTTAGPYRLEFTALPPGYQPAPYGTSNDTTVQFLPDGDSTDVNAGILIPGNYCQDNPQLVTTCYVFGGHNDATLNADDPVFISFPYSAGSTTTELNLAPGETEAQAVTRILDEYDTPTGHEISIPSRQLGTTFGIAHDPRDNMLYTSAFMKRHSDYGPNRQGAIYSIDPTTNATALFTTVNAGPDAHNTADFLTDNGDAGWDAVGKTSFGGITLDYIERNLFAVNLFDQSVIRIGLDDPTVRQSAIVPTPPNCPSRADVRPFAAKYYRGTVYIGVVCSAESTVLAQQPTAPADRDLDPTTMLGNANALRGYVYALDPVAMTYSAPVLQFGFGYDRSAAEIDPNFPARWRPWVPYYVRMTVPAGRNQALSIYPQPMISDLSFDNGRMYIAVRDRNADQVGDYTRSEPGEQALRFAIPGGDLLCATGSVGGGWSLENNGTCGMTSAGAGNNQGPGGGEFFADDDFRPDGVPHDEVTLGGIAHIPGYPDVLTTVFDPVFIPSTDIRLLNTGGIRWFNQLTGAFERGYLVYPDVAGTLGKANGLGDVEPLCNLAPVEIGNLVWYDPDIDGVQGAQVDPAVAADGDEYPVAGVEVTLWEIDSTGAGAVQIASATTNATGNYYFSNAAGTSSSFAVYDLPLVSGRTYEVRIALGQAPLVEWEPTLLDAASTGADDDIRDSDGDLSTDGSYVFTAFTLGDPGFNNHTYDFGFYQPGLATETPTPTVTATGTTTETLTPTSTGTITETPAISETPTQTGTPGPSPTPSQTGTPGPSPTVTQTGTLPPVTPPTRTPQLTEVTQTPGIVETRQAEELSLLDVTILPLTGEERGTLRLLLLTFTGLLIIGGAIWLVVSDE